MRVGDVVVQARKSAKYLGVTLDSELTCCGHIRNACEGIAEANVFVIRLMANVGEPSFSKRRFLMLTVQSILIIALTCGMM